jgi:MYXO-CTERM domain-containing protein
LAALLAFLALAPRAWADTPYTITYSSGSYTAITGGTTYAPVAYAQGYDAWDEGAAAISLPFPFNWFGVTFDTLYAYDDGFVSFDPPPTGSGVLRPPVMVPSPSNAPHDFIAPMFADLIGGPGAEIRAATSGAMGQRVFTVQLTHFQRFNNAGSDAAFQVHLYEAGGADFVYGPSHGISGATVGIENADGTDGASLLDPGNPSCGQHCCAPASCGSIDWPVGFTVAITRPALPELIGTIQGPPGAYPGASFLAHVLIANVGQAAAGAFTSEIRLSADPIIDPADTLLGTIHLAGLAAGTSSAAVVRLTMPAGLPRARFTLGLRVNANGAVMEADPSNDTSIDPGGLVSAPDLVVSVDGPRNSGAGEQIAVTVAVRSVGLPVVTPIGLTVLLSSGSMPSPGDRTLLSTNVTLPDGLSTIQTYNLLIPADVPPSPPDYHLLAVVDPMHLVPELDTTNDVGVAPDPITLSIPDLAATGVSSGIYAFRGLPYPIVASLMNNGGTAARGFRVCALLSTQPVPSMNDLLLARSATISLAGAASGQVRLEPVIPTGTASGAYYLGIIVDCDHVIADSNPGNNEAVRTGTVAVRDPAPDFAPFEVDTASTAAAGETTPITFGIGNAGNLAGATNVRLVIAESPMPTAADLSIYDSPMPIMLAPGEDQTQLVWAALPSDLPSGTYRIALIADPENQVAEIDETNNVLVSRPLAVVGADLAILTPPPPNATIGVAYAWRFHAVGGAGGYLFGISWDAAGTPPGLTFDPALGQLAGTPSPVAMGRHNFTVSVMSGGQIASRDYSVLILPPTLPLQIISGHLPPAIARELYAQTLVAVGGTPPYSWAPATGTLLPAGFQLTPDGQIGGRPALVQTYVFGVQCTDANGTVANAMLTVDVLDPTASININTADIPSGQVGDPYLAQFAVVGGTPPYIWSIEAASLPGGLSFDPSQAQLTGTPTVTGNFPFVVEVRDAHGLFDRDAYLLQIFPLENLVVQTGQGQITLPVAQVGERYLDAAMMPVRLQAGTRAGMPMTAVQNLPPASDVSWMLLLGKLPDGLSLDAASGAIQGTPTTAGLFPFVVLAVDPTGDSARATLAISVDSGSGTHTSTTGGGGCGCRATDSPSREGPAPGLALVALAAAALFVAARRRRS